MPRVLGPKAAPERYYPGSQRDKGEERLLQPGRRESTCRAGHLEKVVMFCDVIPGHSLARREEALSPPFSTDVPIARAQRKD